MIHTIARRRIGLTITSAAAAMTVAMSPATAHAASTYSLLILPDQGRTAIYDFVDSAHTSIDMTMYELRDPTMTTDLVNRQKAGVRVRVILDGAHKSVNQTAFNALHTGGVAV